MEGTYVKNLICKVIDKSESNNWDNAVMEWKLLIARKMKNALKYAYVEKRI